MRTRIVRDRNQKYHRYEPLDASPQVQVLLDYLNDRADPIFWRLTTG